MKPIGVGIVGLSSTRGWAASAHVPALCALPDFALVAASGSSAERAQSAAERFGVPSAFGDPVALARCPDVDLVVVTVKVPHHLEIVTAAVEAGKHVLCEWPLGRTLAEAEEMAAMGRARGVRTFIGLQARSAPAFAYLRDLLADGFVGRPTSVTVTGNGNAWGAVTDTPNAYIADVRNGATLLTIPVAHTVDGLCSLFGEIEALVADLGNSRSEIRVTDSGETIPLTAPDKVALMARLAGGTTLSLAYRGGGSPGDGLRLEIHGTEGELHVTGGSGHAQLADLAISGTTRGGALTALPVPDHYFSTTLRSGPAVAVAEQYAAIGRDLRDGTATCPTFDEAVRRHRFVAAVEQSVSRSEWVSLER